MKKITKIRSVLVLLSVVLFTLLNPFFPYDGYYSSLERCEKSDESALTGADILLKCPAGSYIYEVSLNDKGELYFMQIATKNVFGITKYRIMDRGCYYIEKYVRYCDEVGRVTWNNCPAINIYKAPVFSWCLVRKSDSAENMSDTYEHISYGGEEYILFYKIQ